MQLLDSCALPEAQFATLTILLQLNDIYDSQYGSQNVSGLLNENDERGGSSHSLLLPEDGDQNSDISDTEGNPCKKSEDDARLINLLVLQTIHSLKMNITGHATQQRAIYTRNEVQNP